MRVLITDAANRSYTKALSPQAWLVSPPYDERPTPTLVVRQTGDAWDQPFAKVFEPILGDPDSGSVREVRALLNAGNFPAWR